MTPMRLLFTYILIVAGKWTQIESSNVSSPLQDPATTQCRTTAPTVRIFGYRIDSETTDVSTTNDVATINIPPDKLTFVHFFGEGLDRIDQIDILSGKCGGSNASVRVEKSLKATDFLLRTRDKVKISHEFPVGNFMICPMSAGALVQPEDGFVSVQVLGERDRSYKLGGLWITIVVLVVLHVLSALFSGLSLGLMTLTVRELEIIAKSGSEQEQKYAKTILPLRRRGNQLLCTLLLGNTLCNATISILIEDVLPKNWPEHLSIAVATLTMLMLGEILPQSICVNNALATGARMLWFAHFCVYAFAIVAWPISKVLDLMVGEEHESYDRKRLMELMNRVIANNASGADNDDELKIAVGAMTLKGKIVQKSMTEIDDVFMLPETANLNSSAIMAIVRAGYTRIPVFKAGNKKDICDVLITKDLALIDPDDNYTVRTLCNIYKRPIPRMRHDTTLFQALQTFRKGDDGHLAVVVEKGEVIGIITLEDVVEEILQEEIKDEFDLKREKKGHEKILWDTTAPPAVMGKQLQHVTYQFCVANEEAFAERLIDKDTFKRLMACCTKNVDVTHLKPLGGALTVPIKQLPKSARLYTKDEMSDRYILILEGRAEVTIGQGGMKFDAGPFQRFGQELLKKLMAHAEELCKKETTLETKQLMQFKPDFSVTVFEDCTFLEVTAETYIKALRVTRMKQEGGSSGAVYANFKSPGISIEPSPTRLPLMGGLGSKEKMAPKEGSPRSSPGNTGETGTTGESESNRAEGK